VLERASALCELSDSLFKSKEGVETGVVAGAETSLLALSCESLGATPSSS